MAGGIVRVSGGELTRTSGMGESASKGNCNMARYFGTNRSEIIYGSNFRDIIHGNGGNDDIYGRDGHDDLYGDAGNDRLYGGYGDDYMRGGEGQNTYTGGYGYDIYAMSNRSVGYTEDRITDFRPRSDKIDVSAWGISSFDQILAIMYGRRQQSRAAQGRLRRHRSLPDHCQHAANRSLGQ